MITDYCSWQGMLVLTGVDPTADGTQHIIRSEEHGAALWLGDVDDLFSFGKPVGTGGPWRNSQIKAGENSDPYLMLGYDKKSVSLSHDATDSIVFTLEIDPTGTGAWNRYRDLICPPGEATNYDFPTGFSAHWIRVRANDACTATCTFRYEQERTQTPPGAGR